MQLEKKLETRADYYNLAKVITKLPKEQKRIVKRYYAKSDLYFLCLYVLGWTFYDCDFAFNFCKKVEENPWKLWLVARGHLKSLTLTTAHNIQLVLNNPDITIAIISYNLKIARSFIRQIKQEIENNQFLKENFDDIFYRNPEKESLKWSEQEGLIIKRNVIRKEPTFYSFGLVDSQATGMHFDIHSFDDAVTQDSVTSGEMIQKTTERWQLSDNLGMSDKTLKKYAGTRYHYFDTYKTMIDIGIQHEVIPATDNGEPDGKPIFFTKETIEEKRKLQGSYMFSSQMLLKPVAKEDQKFNLEMIHFYESIPRCNIYVAVDPANAKKKRSDYTACWVFGYSEDRKVYIIDGFHDKLNLKERYSKVRFINEKYKPDRFGYETYSIQTDIDYMRMENDRDGYYIPFFEIKGTMSKEDRILRLIAMFENGDILFPKSLLYWSGYRNQSIDIIQMLSIEMLAFPFGEHDDLLDCLSRMFDLFINNPSSAPKKLLTEEDTMKAGYRFERLMNKSNQKPKW